MAVAVACDCRCSSDRRWLAAARARRHRRYSGGAGPAARRLGHHPCAAKVRATVSAFAEVRPRWGAELKATVTGRIDLGRQRRPYRRPAGTSALKRGQGLFLVALIFSLIDSKLILPAHLAHVPLMRRHRPSAPAVRKLGAGAIPYPGGRFAGIRRAVRCRAHADPAAGAGRHRRGCHRIFPAHPARANYAKHLSALPISLDKPRPHSQDMASFGSGGISPD